MQNAEYAARVDATKRRAHGRWTDILGAMGLDERMLKRKPMACPVCCDGEDRFQYTDKFGEGNYHCRKCGPGGGVKLLQACKGMDFHTALCAVEKLLGVLPPARPADEPTPDRMKKLAQRIWNEARTRIAMSLSACCLRWYCSIVSPTARASSSESHAAWTLTLAAALLRQTGTAAVYPFALAATTAK